MRNLRKYRRYIVVGLLMLTAIALDVFVEKRHRPIADNSHTAVTIPLDNAESFIKKIARYERGHLSPFSCDSNQKCRAEYQAPFLANRTDNLIVVKFYGQQKSLDSLVVAQYSTQDVSSVCTESQKWHIRY